MNTNMLIIYPKYTPSVDEFVYRASMAASVNDDHSGKSMRPSDGFHFQSTSVLLNETPGGGSGDAPTIDWTIGGSDINTGVVEGDYSLAEIVPVGDTFLPLTLMLLGYVLYRRLAAKLKSL